MTIAESVKEKVGLLPVEKQQQVLGYIEQLERVDEGARPLENPRGILAGLVPDISFEEFQQLRREAWGTSTDRELDWPK